MEDGVNGTNGPSAVPLVDLRVLKSNEGNVMIQHQLMREDLVKVLQEIRDRAS